MLTRLPQTIEEFSAWTWEQVEASMQELSIYSLTSENLEEWLSNWSRLLSLLEETLARLHVAVPVDTSDQMDLLSSR